MTTARTPEQEAVYQRFISEATEMVVEMNRRISELANKETTFCSPGCAACCNQIFGFHPVEFEVICNRIVGHNELRQLFEWKSAQRKILIDEKVETIKEISKLSDTNEFMRKWIDLKIPCSLLFEDKCLIYDVRPVACSTYLTLSPPRVCAIDPKGYLSAPMRKLKDEHGAEIGMLNKKYGIKSGEYLFDLSWHLDHYFNSAQTELANKKRRKNHK